VCSRGLVKVKREDLDQSRQDKERGEVAEGEMDVKSLKKLREEARKYKKRGCDSQVTDGSQLK